MSGVFPFPKELGLVSHVRLAAASLIGQPPGGSLSGTEVCTSGMRGTTLTCCDNNEGHTRA